jgi:hypothetical protein
MPYISEIVDIINSGLKDSKLSDDKRFIKKLCGLSELLIENSQYGITIPSLIDINGGITFSGFDDMYSIIIYHRCLSTQIVQAPIAFGDGWNVSREEALMRMIVYADRNITRLNPTQLSFLINSGVTQQLTQSQIQNYDGLLGVNIESISTNYDGMSIYTNEYRMPSITYPISPNKIYLALDYKITTDYDLTCISDCPSC